MARGATPSTRTQTFSTVSQRSRRQVLGAGVDKKRACAAVAEAASGSSVLVFSRGTRGGRAHCAQTSQGSSTHGVSPPRRAGAVKSFGPLAGAFPLGIGIDYRNRGCVARGKELRRSGVSEDGGASGLGGAAGVAGRDANGPASMAGAVVCRVNDLVCRAGVLVGGVSGLVFRARDLVRSLAALVCDDASFTGEAAALAGRRGALTYMAAVFISYEVGPINGASVLLSGVKIPHCMASFPYFPWKAKTADTSPRLVSGVPQPAERLFPCNCQGS